MRREWRGGRRSVGPRPARCGWSSRLVEYARSAGMECPAALSAGGASTEKGDSARRSHPPVRTPPAGGASAGDARVPGE